MPSTAGPLAVRKLTRKMHLGSEEAPAQHTLHTVCYAWVIVSRLQSASDALHKKPKRTRTRQPTTQDLLYRTVRSAGYDRDLLYLHGIGVWKKVRPPPLLASDRYYHLAQ